MWALFAVALAAPSTVLNLSVLEYGSGRPLPEVTVVIEGQRLRPGVDGRLTAEVAPGVVQVQLSSFDHEEQLLSVQVDEGQVVEHEVRLHRYSWQADEMVVYGDGDEEAVSRQVLTIEELRRVPGSFGDPVRALQSLPGVARPRSVQGALVVRGAESVNTKMYLDGVAVPFLFHFLVGKSIISPSMIEDVEFYPGAMPTRFGDVSQAVVNSRTHRGELEKRGVHGDLHVDFMEVGGAMGVNLPKDWTLRLSGRGSWLAALARMGQLAFTKTQSDFRPAGLRVPYSDGLMVLQKPLSNGRFYVSVFGAEDGIRYIPAKEKKEQGWVTVDASLDGGVDRNDLLRARFIRGVVGHEVVGELFTAHTFVAAGVDRQRNLMPGLGVFGDIPQDTDASTGLVQFRHTNRLTLKEETLFLRTGVDLRSRPSKVKDLQTAEVFRDHLLWGSPFVEGQAQLGPLYLAPGFRTSIHSFHDEVKISHEPRVSVKLDLSDSVQLHGFSGLYSQVPTLDRYKNAKIPLELMTSHQNSLGFLADIGGVWDLSATGFYTLQQNILVTTDVTRVVPAGNGTPQYYAQTNTIFEHVPGVSYGVEARVRRQPTAGWFGWVSLTVGRAERTLNGSVVPSDVDTRVNGTFVVAKDFSREWGVSGKLQVGSGQPFDQYSGVYMTNLDGYFGQKSSVNGGRYGVFHQLDIRVDKTFTRKKYRWTAYVDIFNVTAAKNALSSSYNWDFSKNETRTWLPVIPTAGVEVAF